MAGASFPVTAAVGDFHEPPPGLVEQRVGFGPPFDGARFGALGPFAHQIPYQVAQQVLPELAAHLPVAGLRDRAAAHTLCILRKLSANVLRDHPANKSLRARRKLAALDPDFRFSLLTMIPSIARA